MKYFPALRNGVAVVLATALCVQGHTAAAEARQRSSGRPKIGLVLSGGGALGVSHVGALNALEELNIPIDYIAGASMGSVVGGLYASGMSPAELEDWFRKANWHFLLSDILPRESESIRNKQREFDTNQGVTFNVTLKDGWPRLLAGRQKRRRVEPAFARWLPHKPGRADFPHPVLPVEVSPENTDRRSARPLNMDHALRAPQILSMKHADIVQHPRLGWPQQLPNRYRI